MYIVDRLIDHECDLVLDHVVLMINQVRQELLLLSHCVHRVDDTAINLA